VEQYNDKANQIIEKNEWMNDYIEGKDYEIYKISLNSKRGYYFGDIVNMIYNNNNGIILFGLHIESTVTQDSIVYLAPLTFKLPKDDQTISIYGYILAKNQSEATTVMDNLKMDKMESKYLKFNSLNRMSVEDPYKQFNFFNKLDNFDNFQEEGAKQDNNILFANLQGKYLTDKIILSDSYHVSSERILKENAIYKNLQNKLVLKRGHIIICGISQNLIDFIKPIRAKYIPKENCPSIVILNQKLPSDKIWNSISYFDEIFLVQGNPMNEKDLLRAGILSASKVVILSPSLNEVSTIKTKKKEEKKENDKTSSVRSLTRNEEDLLDSITILKYNLITEMNSEIFCLIELINPNNISLIKNKSRKNIDEYVFIKSGFDITFTTSFATGEVYYSNVMDNLMSQIYYNPNLLGVIKKIIMGENQKQIVNNSLKKYYNVKSGNLYLIDMPPLEDIKDISIDKDKNDKDNLEVCYKDVFKYLLLHKNMITIGLYKNYSKRKEISNITHPKKRKTLIRNDLNALVYDSEMNFYYVFTSPGPDLKVTNKDKLFVISTVYPGKNSDIKDLDNQINNDDFNLDKNEMDRKSNKMKNLESKQNLDREGEKKLEKINDTIDEMKSLINTTNENLLKLGSKAREAIPESIKNTITKIYETNSLP
jgi:hypothetical protein